MNNIIYQGPFKDHLKNYIELKQAIGYKHHTEAGHLRLFDQFTLEKYPEALILSKQLVLNWCRKKTYEAQANQSFRATIMRQFGTYLNSIGLEAFILPKGYCPRKKQYVPHIYTAEELAKFFAQTDQCQYCYECPNRHFYYACSLSYDLHVRITAIRSKAS